MSDRPITFRKKTLVTGVQAKRGGLQPTERGIMEYVKGDWLLSTTEGPEQTWPVTQEYLDANYEVVAEEVPDAVAV